MVHSIINPKLCHCNDNVKVSKAFLSKKCCFYLILAVSLFFEFWQVFKVCVCCIVPSFLFIFLPSWSFRRWEIWKFLVGKC